MWRPEDRGQGGDVQEQLCGYSNLGNCSAPRLWNTDRALLTGLDLLEEGALLLRA